MARTTTLGALMVLTDITELTVSRCRIRRRIAGQFGTLSAGMAHEIKNPLGLDKDVCPTITRASQDSRFPRTFFSLIGHRWIGSIR